MTFASVSGYLEGERLAVSFDTDCDPTNVIVLKDEPAFPGSVLQCQVVGIIEGEQGKKKKLERNDRIMAVDKENHSFADAGWTPVDCSYCKTSPNHEIGPIVTS